MNYEDLESEFRYSSVKDMVEKTLQEIQKSMRLANADIGALGRNFNKVNSTTNGMIKNLFVLFVMTPQTKKLVC